jgi:thiol-disulfide isomerase/thioredoxin
LVKRLLPLLCLAIIVVAAVACSKGGNDSGTGPDRALPFSLPDIEGQTFSLADYRGKVVVLEFFTTWCEPCRYSAPLLQEISERYKDKGVSVIAVSLDEGKDVSARLKTFRERHKVSYRIALGNANVKKQYNAYALPTTYIFDRNGAVAVKYHGITQNYSQRLAGEIEKLINKK